MSIIYLNCNNRADRKFSNLLSILRDKGYMVINVNDSLYNSRTPVPFVKINKSLGTFSIEYKAYEEVRVSSKYQWVTDYTLKSLKEELPSYSSNVVGKLFFKETENKYRNHLSKLLEEKGYFYSYCGEVISTPRQHGQEIFIVIDHIKGYYYFANNGSRKRCYDTLTSMIMSNLKNDLPDFNSKNEKEPKMTNSINESSLIVTLNPEQFQFVQVFVPHANKTSLTYKAPKGLYVEGDLVVVPVGDHTTVGTITSTKVKLTEINDKLFYKWVFTKIDLSAIEEIQAKEVQMLETIREAQQLHQQKVIRDGVLAQLNLNIEDIFKTDNLLTSDDVIEAE